MQWSDAFLVLLLAALVVILFQYVRLARKNRRLHQLADEANRLRHEAAATEQRNRQLKQEMTSNIAHELKTPVSSIRGYLEILLGPHPVDAERRQHYLERSYQQTLRLSDLIQDVSLIGKLEESADLFPLESCDLHLIAHEAIADLAPTPSHTVSLLLPSPMPIVGNRELLYSIFRNLVENALTHAGSAATITIEPYKPNSSTPNQYYIHFYDTGCGVPDEALPRLFDRFVRLDNSRSRRSGGTGLGLSIVKHAVHFHGGQIIAKNRVGGGLEFYFSLSAAPHTNNKPQHTLST